FIGIVIVKLRTVRRTVILLVKRLFPVVFNGGVPGGTIGGTAIIGIRILLIDGCPRFGANYIRADFIQEAGSPFALLFAIFVTAAAVTEKEHIFGSGDSHIKQAPLFFNIDFLIIAAADRKELFFQADDKNGRKLESLGSVNCHHGYRRFVLIVFIGIGDQADLLQEGAEGGIIIVSFVIGDGIFQLQDIFAAAHRLGRIFLHQRLHITRPFQQLLGDIDQFAAVFK